MKTKLFKSLRRVVDVVHSKLFSLFNLIQSVHRFHSPFAGASLTPSQLARNRCLFLVQLQIVRGKIRFELQVFICRKGRKAENQKRGSENVR